METELCGCGSPTVNVPGTQGDPGNDGMDGCNAYSTVTGTTTFTTKGDTFAVEVDSTCWMVVGQIVVMDGPFTFMVVSVGSDTEVTLTFLEYPGDDSGSLPVNVIGKKVSPAGVLSELPDPITVRGVGTDATLTDTPALLDFGTTDPSLTMVQAGTFLVSAWVRLEYNAWQSTSKTVTVKLRETNNTNTDLFSSDYVLPDTSSYPAYHTVGDVIICMSTYVTTAIDDVLQIWGSVENPSDSGAITASCAEITIQRIN